MTTLPIKTIQPRRYKPGGLGNWSGHLPFVHDLIEAMRPSLFVELGTHYGESYFGVCQAVEENGVSCRCFAVDTWCGDAHAGFYDDSVFHEVHRYNRAHYGGFSSLLRTTFDEARSQFADESIDLLHIDGLHTYETVKHDVEYWLPKVRAGGIVMLHDIEARQPDFGVWKVWDELTAVFPHFVFTHSWGLGLIRKPGAEEGDSDLVKQLWAPVPRHQDFIRHYYALKAEALDAVQSTAEHAAISDVFLQVFPCVNNGYSEEHAVNRYVRTGAWTDLSLALPQGSPDGQIRLDPSDRACSIELAALRLRREVDGSLLHCWTQAGEISAWQRSDVFVISFGQTAKFLATDRDPHILLPDLGPQIGDQPLVLEIKVRMDLNIADAIQSLDDQRTCDCAASDAIQKATLEREAALANVESLRASVEAISRERGIWQSLWFEMMGELAQTMHDTEVPIAVPDQIHLVPDEVRVQWRAVCSSLQHNLRAVRLVSGERDRLALERNQLQSDLTAVRAEIRKLRIDEMTSTSELRQVEARAKALAGDLDDLRRQISIEREKHLQLQRDLLARDIEARELREGMQAERSQRIALLNSYSWKISAPFRGVIDLLRGSGVRR